MKMLFLAPLLLLVNFMFAQPPCTIDLNITDSLGTYKSTKPAVIYERNFARNSNTILFSLAKTNEILFVNMQIVQQSDEFIKAKCFDASSKIFIQLNNGKIATLLYNGNETCGSFLQGENNKNNRIISGYFNISASNYEDLKQSPVTYMRVKYAGETKDYPFQTKLTSQLDGNIYKPENYFIENLQCIAD